MARAYTSHKWPAVAITVLFFALLGALGAFFNWLGSGPLHEWRVLLSLVLVFGAFGAGYGIIVALDGESGMSYGDHPVLRTLLCGVVGAGAFFLIASWHSGAVVAEWAVLGGGVGALGGFFGWSWTRYMDFM